MAIDRLLQQTQDEHGSSVVARREKKWPIGAVIDPCRGGDGVTNSPYPVVVIGYTDLEQWAQQHRLTNIQRRSKDYQFFHQVVAE